MAQRFVDAVGRGIMRLLVFDRGLIDGKTVSRLKEQLGVDSLFPLKKGMDLWKDAKVLARQDGQRWERYDRPPPKPVVPPPDRPESVTRREATRQETLRKRRAEVEPEPPARTLEWIEYKAIEPSQVWESCSVPVNVLLSATTTLTATRTLFSGPGGTRFAIVRKTTVLVKFRLYLDRPWRVRSAGASA